MHSFISFLIILTVLCSQPSLYSTNYVYKMIDGTMSYTWRLNFSIFVNEFNGVILHCFDTANNQLGIKIKRISSQSTKIQIMFNKDFKLLNLTDLCGCDPCNERTVTFRIEAKNRNIEFRCNDYSTEVIHIDGTDNHPQKGQHNLYAIPTELKNKREKLFVMLGNIGPCDNQNGTTTFPVKFQMEGCVYEFYFGDSVMRPVTFEQLGTKVRPSCFCNTAFCNGGSCHKTLSQKESCDCSLTALNGPYCNQSLTMDYKTENNSYVRLNESKYIYLKMTWREMLDKELCLLEIVSETKHVTISINKSRLMLDSRFIFKYKTRGINFVSVNVTKDTMVIKTENYESSEKISLAEVSNVNVGFSEKRGTCPTFEGKYDLLYDTAVLKQVSSITTKDLRFQKKVSTVKISNDDSVLSTQKIANDSGNEKKSQSSSMIIVLCSGITVVVIISLCAANLIIILRNKNKEPHSNTYELSVGLPNPAGDTDAYSLIYYQKVDSSSIHIYDDGYMVPNPRSPDDILPTVPIRFEL